MAMVYCKGCAKEIHESARSCPHCGAVQGIAETERNTFVLVLIALGWSLVMWVISLFLLGLAVGILNPENAEMAGAEFGEAAGAPFLLISLVVSGILTTFGKLPGTYKKI